MDLALLTAREIANFLDPEMQAHELVFRRDPQTHLSDPEKLPDPRTDPTFIQLLHAWAEGGALELETAAARETAANHADSAVALKELKDVMSLSVTIEDSGSRDNRCTPGSDVLRAAAIGPLIDAGMKVVADERGPRTLAINLTALPVGAAGCAAFLSVSLRALPNAYQRSMQSVGSKLVKDEEFLTGRESEFAERATDQLRLMVGGVVSEIKAANQTR